MEREGSFFWKILVCVLLTGGVALAQVSTGTILGTVSDSTGAVIPGATVTVRNVETGISRTVTTDETGRYRAAQLGLGSYEVTAESAGFQSVVRSGITLTIGREAAVDFSMQVGAVSEKITVTGEAPMVEATSSTVSAVVEGQTIRELPLNGRSFDQLALLQPGVFLARTASTGTPGFTGGTAWISVGGARPTQSATLYDGTNINGLMGRAGAGVGGRMLGVDAIREFRFLTNNYSAEYGRATGGVMNIVTRSGTNEFHGSAFEFLRNSAMDARDFFNPATTIDRATGKTVPNAKPAFKRNQFGASIGGPIAKDRTFFFATYEGLVDRLSTVDISFVPNQKARDGFLPSTTNPAVLNNVGVNAAVKPFLELFPLPNGPEVGQGLAQLTSTNTANTNEHLGQIRIDHQINENHSLFGRWTIDRVSFNTSSKFFSWNDATAESANDYFTLQHTAILSPTMLNTARVGFVRVGYEKKSVTEPAILRFGNSFPRIGSILISAVGGTGIGIPTLGVGIAGGDFRPLRNMFEYSDDVSVTKGSHAMKFGAVVERFRDSWFYDYQAAGEYSFGSLQSFLQNRPSQFRGGLPAADPRAQWRQWLVGLYAQDDFAVTPNLTLNLGVRYEFISNPTNAINRPGVGTQFGVIKDALRDTNFSLTEQAFVTNPSLKNIAPRFGFAWNVSGDGKTAVRGGFGMSYDQLLAQYYVFLVTNPPLLTAIQFRNPVFPNIYGNLPPVIPSANDSTDHNVYSTPSMMQYNLNVQRELPGNMAVQAGYVGSLGRHLGYGRDENTPFQTVKDGRPYIVPGSKRRNPKFEDIGLRYFGANSWYNSLQLSLQKRVSRGFQMTASYTFSKSTDDFSKVRIGEGLSGRTAIQNPDCLPCDRGLSDFHRAHVYSTNYSYELPLGPNRAIGGNLTGVPGVLIGGWDISGIVSYNSGVPNIISVSFDRPGLLTVGSSRDVRPDLKSGFSNNPTSGTTAGCTGVAAGQQLGDPARWFDPCAFSLQPAGFFGNLGRNTVIQPGLLNFDFSLVKNSRWGEGKNVQFRAEFFNIFNTPQFGRPLFTVFTSATGVPAATSGRITTTAADNRRVQFGLKITF